MFNKILDWLMKMYCICFVHQKSLKRNFIFSITIIDTRVYSSLLQNYKREHTYEFYECYNCKTHYFRCRDSAYRKLYDDSHFSCVKYIIQQWLDDKISGFATYQCYIGELQRLCEKEGLEVQYSLREGL